MRYWLLLSFPLVLGAMSACEEQPCDRYVDYICTCHEDNPDFDCQELIDVLSGAEPDIQDQCSIDLSDQQEQDAADGLTCDI